MLISFDRKHLLILAAYALFSLTGAAQAATFFVATSGNDSFPGTETQPFRSIKRGLSSMRAGDKLYIRAGTYAEGINSSSQVIPTGTSWADAPLISAYPGEKVILQLPSTSTSGFQFDLQSPYLQYVIISGLVLDGGSQNIKVGSTAHHIKFENMELKNGFQQCVYTGTGTHDLWFSGGSVHDCGLPMPVADAGYPFYVSGNDHVLENIEVYNSNSFCFHVYDTNIRPQRIIVRNNIIHHCALQRAASAGILVKGDNHLVYNNVVYKNNGHGIMTYGAANAKFYNNTVYGGMQSGIYVYPGSTGTQLRNNISYANATTQILDEGAGTILSKNVVTDPRFMNAATLDFSLQATSVAIDAGELLSEVSTDIRRRARPQGFAHDVGAYETGTTSAPSPPRNLSVR
jgi:parallel beta-helix repeat protein